MPDPNNDVTPDAGTTTSDQTQPQTDPVTPQGTTVQADQQGTTADQVRADKEALYQTKYQQLKKEFDELRGQVDTYESQFGTLQGAFQNQQGQPQPQPQGQPAGDEVEFDPYDPNSMKAYMDHNFNTIRGNLTDIVRQAQQQIRMEERQQAEMDREFGTFNKWAAQHQIPQDKINLSVKRYAERFGSAGTPTAFVEWVTDDIARMMAMDQDTARQAQLAKEAAEKAKALAGVQQPAPGMPPSPTKPDKKTWQEERADVIAPPDPEPKYD